MRVTSLRFRRRIILTAAVLPVVAIVPPACATGDFDGGQLPSGGTRLWDVGGANPGINWVGDTLPVASVDPIVFSTDGDGIVDLNALVRKQPSLAFGDWTSYTLTDGTFTLSAGGALLKVGSSVNATYGSSYFADGNTIASGLDLGTFAASQTILFTGANTGNLRLSGALAGATPLVISKIAAGLNTRPVYFDLPNGGYSGSVTVNPGTAARLLSSGRTGTGAVNVDGGEFAILSDAGGGEAVTNTFNVSSGTIRADHNYTASPTPAYAPGITHVLGPGPGTAMTLDNPTDIGGTNDASVTFTADNGYNIGLYALKLGNAHVPLVPAGSRTVIVSNGNRTTGYAGSVRLTGNNRLQEQVVTTFVGPPGGAVPSYSDIDPATGTGIPLLKSGSGVLAIEGPNEVSSTGGKNVDGGVLRFGTAMSYGTTTGVPGGPPVTVTLMGIPPAPGVPVSAGMGVGYATPVPPNLTTTGGIPGQSGAFDIDVTAGSPAPFMPAIVNTSAVVTGLRLGSSGGGVIVGPVMPYDDFGLGLSTYFWGGGGGTLTIASPPMGPGAFPTSVEMGTTGTLLPGRVKLTSAVTLGAAPLNMVKIRAGTLEDLTPGLIGNAGGGFGPGMTGGTSLGCYSTTLGLDGSYGGAPAGTPYNGPGQLELDSTMAYVYVPGGHFGIAGLVHSGGALGFTGPGAVALPAFPGVYGTTLASTLYTSAAFPGAPVATNILHFGGEYSGGTIMPTFVIANNGGTPVALLKSGVDSTLDLTGVAANTYTGGTGILGGEVLVNTPAQLGPAGSGAIVIADGGTLHVGAGGPPVKSFVHHLRVANGPGARASQINVDPGFTASFSTVGFNLEAATPGSILEKTGPGDLTITPLFVYPSTAANTWGVKATAGMFNINQLPGTTTPANGSAVFDGGFLHLVGAGEAGFVAIPAATQYHVNYGFSGLQTYAGTSSVLEVGNPTIAGASAFFRINGAQTSSLMGDLAVILGSGSVVKFSDNAAGGDTRGTGKISFDGGGAVQFTPSAGNVLFPRDGAFTLTLADNVLFSGCPSADFNGNLVFTSSPGNVVFIDGATVSNVPAPGADTWTIAGTGSTAWGCPVIKSQTQAVPGGGGPFSSGIVNLNRDQGAPVSITSPTALLDIEFGTLNAGGTGDPFTDSVTPTMHLPVTNNATFNITAGTKDVASIGGIGVTTVFAGATLLVGSSGPVTQTTFVINGTADVGNVNVSGTTGVGPSPALLSAQYVRGGALSIMSGTAFIKDNGLAAGVSKVATLTIGVGGHLNIRDNHVIVTTTPTGTWNGAVYTDLQGLVASGRNGNVLPLWDGATGIITTMTNATTGNYHSIGIAKASDVRPVTATATGMWAGQTITGTDTLIMYTYGGDATLDGKINIDDYVKIDTGIAGGLTGWSNGDFNYDGKVNIDDYTTVIDANIGIQSGVFFSSGGVSGTDGVAAVPEPLSSGLVIVPTMLLTLRRRSRRAPRAASPKAHG